MAENQVSRIQHRRGTLVDLSGVILNTAEIGFAIDEGRMFIGNRTADGAPLDENIEVITSNTPTTGDLLEFNSQTGTSYVLEASDTGKLLEMDNAAANTVTIPTNATVSFDIGTKIDIIQMGAGQTTFVAAGGVTILSGGGLLSLNAQYSAATLIKRATNEWVLIGDLS